MEQSFNDWLNEVKVIFGNCWEHDYHDVAEHYSFKAAWEDQFSPEKAVRDAIEWLET